MVNGNPVIGLEITRLGTNIFSFKGTFESMIFLFPRWDMLVPRRVSFILAYSTVWSEGVGVTPGDSQLGLPLSNLSYLLVLGI